MPLLYILRGVSGSGKTTLAENYCAKNPNARHVEADMFFTNEAGDYHFDRSELKVAHQWCQSETARLLRNGHDVVVANTFCSFNELSYYVQLAHKHEYELIIEEAKGNFQNVHNVPESAVEMQRRRYQSMADIQVNVTRSQMRMTWNEACG